MSSTGISPFIQRAVLIDDRRLELYWNTQVRFADREAAFVVRRAGAPCRLFHWTSDQEWDRGTLYQKESMRTTLTLQDSIDPAEADSLTVEVLPGIIDYMDRPAAARSYAVRFEPYYTRFYTSRSGIVVKAGAAVQPDVLKMAAAIVDRMLLKIPDVTQELLRRGAQVAVYGLKECAYDIPEHRMGYCLATRHVEGFGGDSKNAISSISEANVMRLRSGRYATQYPHEMILVHEFGHAVHLVGIDGLADHTLSDRIKACYRHAKDAGLWHDTYAISNHEEYFATMGTIWFNVMQEGVDGRWDGIRGPVNTRAELKEYDPQAFALMQELYSAQTLPAPWDRNTDSFAIDGSPRRAMQGYDIQEKFDWDFIR